MKGSMEIGEEDMGQARQTRQRTKKAKTPGKEKTTHNRKSAENDPFETPNCRVREAWDQSEVGESETEDAIQVTTMVPGAPRPNRNVQNNYPKSRTAPGDRAPATRMAERLAAAAAAPDQLATEKADMAANAQIKVLTNLITALMRAMEEQKQAQANQIETLVQQIDALRIEVTEMKETIQTQLTNAQTSPSAIPSYADIARTPPESRPSNLPSLSSMNTTPSTMTDTLYCTIDTSRVEEEDKDKAQPGTIRQEIEREIRTETGYEHWRCTAVIKDPRNTARIRVTCRDETELQLVKQAAQKTSAPGARIMRDQLYPVKIDNANRSTVLDEDGTIRPESMEALGKENEVRIAKMAWLSRRDTGKAYGSMVVYVTKGSDATRLLQGQYFHVAGESAYTRVFEPRIGPTQCYRCQALGHKAFSCTKPQTCAKCAQEGHHHNDCRKEVLKCVPCGGAHESFSKNCRVLHPNRHE